MSTTISKFIKTYDPENFAFSFALKASISMIVCGCMAYYFFGVYGAIFAANASMNIFFINSLDGGDFTKIKYFFLYVILVSMFLPFAKLAYEASWLLFLPTFIWMLFVGLSSLFNQNLNKILSIVNISGLVALIAQSSGNLEVENSIFGIITGGIIASTFRIMHIGTYGKFTKKTYNILLEDLMDMSKNLFNTKSFEHSSSECEKHIETIKKIFANQSSNLKDESIIMHHARAIFYLYKSEDIFHSLIAIKRYFGTIKDVNLLKDIQDEITHNLKELKNIFNDKNADIKTDAIDKLNDTQYPIFRASLNVLYSKFWLIKNGGEDKIKLENTNKKSIKMIISDINLKNPTVQNSIKLALGVSIAILIAQLTQINHGVWIAIGVLSVSRASSYMTKVVGFNNIKGALIGVCLGLVLIYFFKESYIFIPIIIISIFLTFYLKNFPTICFTSMFMLAFTLIFSMIKTDFIDLVVFRVTDILIGFFVAFGITVLFFRRSTELKLSSNFDALIKKLDMLARSIHHNQKGKFVVKENSVLNGLSDYKTAVLESRSENSKIYLEIYKNLYEINSLLINLKDYIKSIQNTDKFNITEAHFNSDINIIITRFEMIGKKLNKLPYYFYDNVEDKLICNDEKIRYLLEIIAQKQAKIMANTELFIR
ncbi:fusaric acid resistance protein [Campylobacter fetus subsp. testudinum]|uniref:FUSC family protein n=1 Tax=Campylobacter fetus TaxID=196 RepID=UPI0008187566|nr:FUSC family protein [Campylobacter fetus]OCR95972.1 fusaric acid resistance protein [Campylobacter fetus subsp. testudinum]